MNSKMKRNINISGIMNWNYININVADYGYVAFAEEKGIKNPRKL
jgi:hypothetical protein